MTRHFTNKEKAAFIIAVDMSLKSPPIDGPGGCKKKANMDGEAGHPLSLRP
jgi:hypothetical protein